VCSIGDVNCVFNWICELCVQVGRRIRKLGALLLSCSVAKLLDLVITTKIKLADRASIKLSLRLIRVNKDASLT
jgi:hypothetical protein